MNLINKQFKLGGIVYKVTKHDGENIYGECWGETYCLYTGRMKIWDVKHWLENENL